VTAPFDTPLGSPPAAVDVTFLYKGQMDFVPRLQHVSPTGWTNVRIGAKAHGRGWRTERGIEGRCHTHNEKRTFVLTRMSHVALVISHDPASPPGN
jgi:hypothetical protein